MNKEQLIDRHAQTLKSYVGTGLAKDECIELIKNAVDEALSLYSVSCQRERLKEEQLKREQECGDHYYLPRGKWQSGMECQDCGKTID